MFRPFKEGQRSRGVIVSFAGGALKFGGHTQHEFVAVLRGLKADALFLVDDHQSFYMRSDEQWDNFERLEQKLKTFLSPYQGALFIGASMGASAALMFSHLSTACLSFAPFIDLDRDPRWDMKLARYRLPAHMRTFMRDVIMRNAQDANVQPRINIQVGVFPGDLAQAKLIEPHARVTVHPGCPTHQVARFLRDRGELLPLLSRMYEGCLSLVRS